MVFLTLNKRIVDNRTKLYQAAYSWTHDRPLADDLTQEAILKALSKKSLLKDVEYFDTWIFRILLNTWHDYLRTKKNTFEIDEQNFYSTDDMQKDYHRGEVVTKVRAEIAKLPMSLREVITLKEYSGFSYKELAVILHIPIGTVMSRLYKARKILQQSLVDLEQPKQSKVIKLRQKL